MPATADKYTTLKAWLQKKAADEPTDGGKPATTGSHASEVNADAKKLVGADSVVGGQNNPAVGKADGAGSTTGLKATTVGKDSENESPSKTVVGEETEEKTARALKTIQEGADKLNSANLSNPAEFDAAFDTFAKMSAELPILLASAGIATAQTSATPRPVGKPEIEKAASHDEEIKNNVARYHEYGAQHGGHVARYLHGFYNAFNLLKQADDSGQLAQLLAAQGAGAPPEAAGAGGPPMPPEAAAGGPPPEAAAAAEHMTPETDDYAAASAEHGLTPEQLEQIIAILQQQVAQEEGGLQPAEKEAVHKALNDAVKIASDVKAHVRAGKFRFKPAADGSPERKRRDIAAKYLEELRTAAG